MITGECPYCNKTIINGMPEQSPMFMKTKCEHCGEIIWLLASRIESIAYTEEAFSNEYEVDEKTKRITKKEVE
jgi:hypothetical protein